MKPGPSRTISSHNFCMLCYCMEVVELSITLLSSHMMVLFHKKRLQWKDNLKFTVYRLSALPITRNPRSKGEVCSWDTWSHGMEWNASKELCECDANWNMARMVKWVTTMGSTMGNMMVVRLSQNGEQKRWIVQLRPLKNALKWFIIMGATHW